MRITNGMIALMLGGDRNAALERIASLQGQVSSGKRIASASDDPFGASQTLSLNSSLAGIDQYLQNTDQAQSQFSIVDSTLNQIGQALQTARQLGLEGATATTTDSQRQSLGVQVQEQINNIVNEINTTSLGHYVFSGFKTQDAPVTLSSKGPAPYQYSGDDGVRRVQVTDSVVIDTSITAKDVLNLGGAIDPSVPDALSILTNLRDSISTGNQQAIQGDLKQLDSSFQNVVSQRGKMGARAMQMGVYQNQLSQTKLSVSQLLSSVNGVDLSVAVTQLQQEQNTYQASLIATSRMIQPSLADYLK